MMKQRTLRSLLGTCIILQIPTKQQMSYEHEIYIKQVWNIVTNQKDSENTLRIFGTGKWSYGLKE